MDCFLLCFVFLSSPVLYLLQTQPVQLGYCQGLLYCPHLTLGPFCLLMLLRAQVDFQIGPTPPEFERPELPDTELEVVVPQLPELKPKPVGSTPPEGPEPLPGSKISHDANVRGVPLLMSAPRESVGLLHLCQLPARSPEGFCHCPCSRPPKFLQFHLRPHGRPPELFHLCHWCCFVSASDQL